jgi:hypothetical protein
MILSATAFAQQSNRHEHHQKCGRPVNGMCLCLSQSGDGDGLTLELRNIGDKDAVLNLGIALANGARQYPTAIALIFRAAGGREFRNQLQGPGVIAGRMDPFLVMLPSDASLKLTLHRSQYSLFFRDTSGDHKHYSVQAQFVGEGVNQSRANLDLKGIALLHYWTGTLDSSAVLVDRPKVAHASAKLQ